MSAEFTIIRRSTNSCNWVAIKTAEILKYLECLAKVYSTVAGNTVRSCW